MNTRSDRPSEDSDQEPRDWRRRRRGRPQAVQPPPAEEAAAPRPDGPEEVLVSRPLVSVIEPALDAVAIYSAPILIAGIIGLVTGITVVAFVTSMRVYGYIDIAIGAALIGLVGAVFLGNVLGAFVSRSGRYGVNTVIILGAFTAIVVILNVISFENTSRMDVTATNQFSLAFRTKDLLNNLNVEVRATAFYKEIEISDDPGVVLRKARVKETLAEFDSRSNKFSYRIVDPDLEPEIVTKYFGARPTSFVAEIVVIENMNTGEFDAIQPTDVDYTQLEQDLVTGTYVATGEEQKRIYFLSGHGERDPGSGESHGYALARNGLEQDNYLVLPLFWGQDDLDVSVPDDAALVVIAGPTSELPETHQTALDLYLEGKNADDTKRRENGSIIFLADPGTPRSFADFLVQWGVVIGDGYIRDLERSVPGLPQTINLATFNPNAPLEIVNPKGQQLQSVIMPGATAIEPLNDDLRQSVPLAVTSTDSYLIYDPDRTDPVTEGENADLQGPFVPALLMRSIGKLGTATPLEDPSEEQISDLVVFGDSDFLANSGYDRGGGADLFLNSANFLVGDFSLVSIRPKAFAFRELNLDANEYDFVRFSSWLFLPGIMALMAGFVWWIRR